MNTVDYINNLSERSFQRKGENNESIGKSAAVANVSASLESRVDTKILASGIDGGRAVFSKSIESSFSISLSFERPEFEFEVPKPSDVAQTVLGFVERRISSEVNAGADNERVSQLLDQARKGVEAGFASAIKDIESLGLMNDSLEEEIVESRSLIDEGIDGIEENYLGESGIIQSTSKKESEVDITQADKVIAESKEDSGRTDTAASLNVFEFFSPSKKEERDSEFSAVDSVSNYKFASRESSEFSLTTNDGDVVSIRFSDSFASVYQSTEGSKGLAAISSHAFEFSVEGELDEGELAAINELLSQVGQVSDLFFENRFQEAFESALSIGFDSSEIAAFSLDLSKAVMQEVRSYGESSNANEMATVNRYQPIIDMSNHFTQIKDALEIFDSPKESMAGLISETLERVKELVDMMQQQITSDEQTVDNRQEVKVSISQFMEFSEYVLLS